MVKNCKIMADFFKEGKNHGETTTFHTASKLSSLFAS